MPLSTDNTTLQLPLAPLLMKLEDIKEHKVLKHCKSSLSSRKRKTFIFHVFYFHFSGVS